MAFLTNAAGLRYSQYGGGPLTIAGRLDVGEQGGTINGSSGIFITGTIAGHSLTLRKSSIAIESPQDQLDVLSLVDSGVSIEANGRLSNLDAIQLNSGSINLSPSSATDRIGESVSIHSNNGSISLYSNASTRTSETIGTLHVDRGYSEVINSSDHGSLQATLTFNRVERQTGALLFFKEAGNVTNTRILSVDTFDGQMIGAWAVTDQGFASLNSQGIVGTLQATSSDLNSAGPTDHVRVEGGDY